MPSVRPTARREILTGRFRPAEAAIIRAAAVADGNSVSAYVRKAVVARARERLRNALSQAEQGAAGGG